MKSRIILLGTMALLSVLASKNADAQVGAPYIHDPSTIVECDGKYYTFGTGGGGLISEDGWVWNSGAVRPGGGAAPDAIKIGDRYLVGYSSTGGGLGGGHAGRILTMWNKTLDPNSPDFAYTEAVEVASSLVDEDCDAIDIGLFMDPTSGRLFATYGTYFGFIRQVELDPKTGHRLEGNEAIDVAIDCEASAMMYHNGWYYLLGTHGTCCDGVNSTYNIIVGRSKKVTGPYVDNMGRDMIKGGGKMVINASERLAGPGHFGRVIIEDGVEKMSCHFEADFDQGGRSTLGIRPLLWKNGWPVAGDLLRQGCYEIESERRGYSLELSVDFVRLEVPRRGGFGGMMGFGGFGGFGANRPANGQNANRPAGAPAAQAAPGAQAGAQGAPAGFGGMGGFGAAPQGGAARPAQTQEAPKPISQQRLIDVWDTWPKGNIWARMGDYMARPHQKWTITEVTDSTGYLGGLYYKIQINGTDRALAVTNDAQVITVPKYTGANEQLWRIDQLTDGTYRIVPKVQKFEGLDIKGTIALVSAGDCTPALAKFDFSSDNSKWNLKYIFEENK